MDTTDPFMFLKQQEIQDILDTLAFDGLTAVCGIGSADSVVITLSLPYPQNDVECENWASQLGITSLGLRTMRTPLHDYLHRHVSQFVTRAIQTQYDRRYLKEEVT